MKMDSGNSFCGFFSWSFYFYIYCSVLFCNLLKNTSKVGNR